MTQNLLENNDKMEVISKEMPATTDVLYVTKNTIDRESIGSLAKMWSGRNNSAEPSYPENDIRRTVSSRLYDYQMTGGNEDLRRLDKSVSEILKDFDPQSKNHNGVDITYSKREGLLTESSVKAILEHERGKPLTNEESDHLSKLFGNKPASKRAESSSNEKQNKEAPNHAPKSYMDNVRNQRAQFESYAGIIIDTNKDLTEEQIAQKILDAQNEAQRARNAASGISNPQAGVRDQLSKSERETIARLYQKRLEF